MPSSLDRLWEMPVAEAALTFTSDYTGGKVGLQLEDPNAKPPTSGEIGLRWVRGGHYVPVSHGLTLLKYDGFKSELLVSEVELEGSAERDEIENAVSKTDSYPLYRPVAQQCFEILWWLRHVRFGDKANSPGWAETSTFPDLPTRFWIEPGGPTLNGWFTNQDEAPSGACLAKGNVGSYADFAGVLLGRLIQRSGIKQRYPMPKVGHHVDPDEDAKFLHTPPPDQSNAAELKRWIGRHAEILRNPERQYLHSSIMERLVPISDPLRYNDRQIDDGLLVVMHRGLAALPELKALNDEQTREESQDVVVGSDDDTNTAKEEEERARRKERRRKERQFRYSYFDGLQAAKKLGFHDAVKTFPELFVLAKDTPRIDNFTRSNEALTAAASIAGRHPNLRPQLAAYLKQKLSSPEERTARGSPLLEALWRADARELMPLLEKLARSSHPAPNPNDSRKTPIENAALILIAWRETDALTKTKLDALLSSEVGGGDSIPEVLRSEFAALSTEDKYAFRQFINWMRTADASVQLHYLENTFTPHTPRPDIPFER